MTHLAERFDRTVTKAQLITAQKYDSEQIFTTYNGDLSEAGGLARRFIRRAERLV